MKLICYLRAIYETTKYFLKTGDTAGTVSGHNFLEEGVYENVSVQVLKCELCGKTNIGWEH